MLVGSSFVAVVVFVVAVVVFVVAGAAFVVASVAIVGDGCVNVIAADVDTVVVGNSGVVVSVGGSGDGGCGAAVLLTGMREASHEEVRWCSLLNRTTVQTTLQTDRFICTKSP